MARQVIGISGTATFLVALDTPIDRDTMAVVVENGRLAGGSAPLQSFIARGYWENWSGAAKDERTILAAVPRTPPIAVRLSA